MTIRISKLLDGLKAYIPGKAIELVAREKGLTKVVKLASNENPLGVSPKALEAIRKTAGNSNRYAEPSAPELKAKLASKLKVESDRIIIGAGVDSLLGYIISAFSEIGDTLLTSMGTFTGIYVHTHKLGRQLETVPLKDYKHDLRTILESITDKTKIIYLANPNNPTGTIFDTISFDSFIKQVPANVLVILDEAYFSYASADPNYPDGLKYNYDNLIVTRTFSKDYGLAGVRVGYAIAHPELIRQLSKIKLPFEPSYTAQQAALAALDDDDFLKRTLDQNRRSLDQLSKAFDAIRLQQLPSWANFIMLTFSSTEFALCFNEECLNRGLILRHVESFGIGNGVRINSGTDDETQFAIDVITKVYRLIEKQFSKPVLGR